MSGIEGSPGGASLPAGSEGDHLVYQGGLWLPASVASVKSSLSLAKADVGLGNVDNTSDAGKPVSTAQQTALDAKSNTNHVHLYQGTLATRPTGTEGDVYIPTDSPLFFRKGASTWDAFGPVRKFTPPVLANFTQANSGTPGSAVEGRHDGIKINSGTWLYEIVKPATPHTLTVAFRMDWDFGGNARAGIYVRDTVSDDGTLHQITALAGSSFRFDRYNSTSVAAGPLGGTSVLEEEAGNDVLRGCDPYWLRISDDGTTRRYYASILGEVWHEVGNTASSSPVTPNRIGFMTNALGTQMTHFIHWELT